MSREIRSALRILGVFATAFLVCLGLVSLGSWGPCGPGSPLGFLAMAVGLLSLIGVGASVLVLLILLAQPRPSDSENRNGGA
jgi:hypothetical protein